MATGGYSDYDANSNENMPSQGWSTFKGESRNANFQGGATKARNWDDEISKLNTVTQPMVDGAQAATAQKNDDAFGPMADPNPYGQENVASAQLRSIQPRLDQVMAQNKNQPPAS